MTHYIPAGSKLTPGPVSKVKPSKPGFKPQFISEGTVISPRDQEVLIIREPTYITIVNQFLIA